MKTETWYRYSSLSSTIEEAQVVKYTGKNVWVHLPQYDGCYSAMIKRRSVTESGVSGCTQTYEEALDILKAYNERMIYQAECRLQYLQQEQKRLNEMRKNIFFGQEVLLKKIKAIFEDRKTLDEDYWFLWELPNGAIYDDYHRLNFHEDESGCDFFESIEYYEPDGDYDLMDWAYTGEEMTIDLPSLREKIMSVYASYSYNGRTTHFECVLRSAGINLQDNNND